MESNDRGDVTRLLRRIEAGDKAAVELLLELVYEPLKHLANCQMQKQRENHTLQTTALVHESFLRLFDDGKVAARDREHFFALAARAMRSALVDHARRNNTLRRSAPGAREPLEEIADSFEDHAIDVLALDPALRDYAVIEPFGAKIVELHFFAFMPTLEIAKLLGVSLRTIERELLAARVWLARRLR